MRRGCLDCACTICYIARWGWAPAVTKRDPTREASSHAHIFASRIIPQGCWIASAAEWMTCMLRWGRLSKLGFCLLASIITQTDSSFFSEPNLSRVMPIAATAHYLQLLRQFVSDKI